MSLMTKTIIFILLIYLTSCNCCALDYETECNESELRVQFYWVEFPGTVYADGFIGYENCSTPNMDPPRHESVVSLLMPLNQCNTTVKKAKKGYFIASNKVIVQFHPLIPADGDCVLNVRCEYFSNLPDGFVKQDTNVLLPTQIETLLEILSGEALFTKLVAEMLEITGKNYAVLHARDGGRYNDIRIRKCFAHANRTMRDNTIPDLLLDDNACISGGLHQFGLLPDPSKGDVRGFSEIQYFRVNTLKKYVYVTCAFELCDHYCKSACMGELEIKTKPWCYVRTHKIKLSDTPFEVTNRNKGIRESLRNLSERLMKFKKNSRISKKKVSVSSTINPHIKEFTINPTLSEEESMAASFNNFTFEGFLQYAQGSIKLDRTGNFNIDGINTNFETEADVIHEWSPEVMVEETISKKRSLDNSEANLLNLSEDRFINTTEYQPNNFNKLIVKREKPNSEVQKFVDFLNIHHISPVVNGSTESNDSICSLVHCISDNSTFGITVTSGSSTVNASLELQETNTIDLSIFEQNSNESESKEKNCVPNVKFISVTASLSTLCMCFFVICICLVLYFRKEKKRFSSHSKYLYSDF